MSNNPPDQKPQQQKPKAPPPRRNVAANAAAAPSDDLLGGLTVRKRVTKTKVEESLLGDMSVAFTAPVRDNTSASGASRRAAAAAAQGSTSTSTGGSRKGPTVMSTQNFISDEDAYKTDFSMSDLHYPPVTVPFQPPHEDTAAWYEQFSAEHHFFTSEIERPQLPAYRDPSYASAIDPNITDDIKLEQDNSMGSGSSRGNEDTLYRSLYHGLPTYQDPSLEHYMVPKLHSAARILSYKPEVDVGGTDTKESVIPTTVTTATKTEMNDNSTTLSSSSSATTSTDPHLRPDINPNLSFVQLPPILHLSQTEPSTRGVSNVEGLFIPQSSPVSYNVNGSTSKAEDVAKLGLITRTRDLTHNGRIGELEIHQSGVAYLVIGNQRFLLQKGPDVMSRQDLLQIKPHPLNPTLKDIDTNAMMNSGANSSILTTTTTTTTTTNTAGGIAMNNQQAQQDGEGNVLISQTTIDQEYIVYNMGHIDNHLIASIDVGDMIKNAETR